MNNTPDTSGLLREADPKEELEAMKEAYRSEHQEVLRLREKVRTQAIDFGNWLSRINPVARERPMEELYDLYPQSLTTTHNNNQP